MLTNLPILTVKVVPVLGTDQLNLEPSLDNLKDLLTRCMEKVLEVNQNIVKVENIMFPGRQLYNPSMVLSMKYAFCLFSSRTT